MASELGAQASAAILISFILQWIKKSKYFPWITVETQTINRWVSIVIAFCAGIGIYATWHEGTLTITGLTAENMFHALTRGVEQWAFQKTTYRGLIAPPQPGVVQYMIDKAKTQADQILKQKRLNNG